MLFASLNIKWLAKSDKNMPWMTVNAASILSRVLFLIESAIWFEGNTGYRNINYRSTVRADQVAIP